jgi:hypothetical protein
MICNCLEDNWRSAKLLAILGTHDPKRFWDKLIITKKHATTFKKCDLELDKQTSGKHVEGMTYLFEF